MVGAVRQTFVHIAAAEAEIGRTWIANRPAAMTVTGLGNGDTFTALDAIHRRTESLALNGFCNRRRAWCR